MKNLEVVDMKAKHWRAFTTAGREYQIYSHTGETRLKRNAARRMKYHLNKLFD